MDLAVAPCRSRSNATIYRPMFFKGGNTKEFVVSNSSELLKCSSTDVLLPKKLIKRFFAFFVGHLVLFTLFDGTSLILSLQCAYIIYHVTFQLIYDIS